MSRSRTAVVVAQLLVCAHDVSTSAYLRHRAQCNTATAAAQAAVGRVRARARSLARVLRRSVRFLVLCRIVAGGVCVMHARALIACVRMSTVHVCTRRCSDCDAADDDGDGARAGFPHPHIDPDHIVLACVCVCVCVDLKSAYGRLLLCI